MWRRLLERVAALLHLNPRMAEVFAPDPSGTVVSQAFASSAGMAAMPAFVCVYSPSPEILNANVLLVDYMWRTHMRRVRGHLECVVRKGHRNHFSLFVRFVPIVAPTAATEGEEAVQSADADQAPRPREGSDDDEAAANRSPSSPSEEPPAAASIEASLIEARPTEWTQIHVQVGFRQDQVMHMQTPRQHDDTFNPQYFAVSIGRAKDRMQRALDALDSASLRRLPYRVATMDDLIGAVHQFMEGGQYGAFHLVWNNCADFSSQLLMFLDSEWQHSPPTVPKFLRPIGASEPTPPMPCVVSMTNNINTHFE